MRKLPIPFALFLLALSGLFSPALAKVTLPAIFSSHMVLQRQTEVVVWGWASPSEEITIVGNWDGKAVQVKADNHANWKATIKTPGAGGPYTLTVMGSNTIVLEDVLIGEVWLASGQSNMEWSAAAGIDNATAEVMAANYPSIRFFDVPNRSADSPQVDCQGEWEACTPAAMRAFSAVAYYFGRRLQEELHIPIGLINCSWGGTPAEAWMDPGLVAADQEFAATSKRAAVPWCPMEPGSTFNGMLRPLIPFRLAGAIWYQGETNVSAPKVYERLFPAMIANWRELWGTELPFYYVQIAPYKYGEGDNGVQLRESQRRALRTPNTGMAVISDIGNIDDIHPRNKLDVGRRLAGWALARTYGVKGIVYSGPLYRDMKVEGDKIRVSFDHAESGLVCRGPSLTHFEVAAADGAFVPAEATIDGSTVLVRASGVKKPAAVRFAWGNTAEPNLFNKEGLPASCFLAGEKEAMGQSK